MTNESDGLPRPSAAPVLFLVYMVNNCPRPEPLDQPLLQPVEDLRETFCTNLSATGVYPRVAMELMRHRDIRQTMKTYTDAAKLPLAAAIQGLPVLAFRIDNAQNIPKKEIQDGKNERQDKKEGRNRLTKHIQDVAWRRNEAKL